MNNINPPRRIAEWGDPAPAWLFRVGGREYADTAHVFRDWLENSEGSRNRRCDVRPMLATRRYWPSSKDPRMYNGESAFSFFSEHSDCRPW